MRKALNKGIKRALALLICIVMSTNMPINTMAETDVMSTSATIDTPQINEEPLDDNSIDDTGEDNDENLSDGAADEIEQTDDTQIIEEDEIEEYAADKENETEEDAEYNKDAITYYNDANAATEPQYEVDDSDNGSGYVHRHDCEYISDHYGKHKIRCVNKCGYERTEECTYKQDANDPNVWVCSRCKGIRPLYLFDNNKSNEVYYYSGNKGCLLFGIQPVNKEYSGSYSLVNIYNNGNKLYDTSNYNYKCSSCFDKFELFSYNSELGVIGTHAGTTLSGLYYYIINAPGGYSPTHIKSPYIGFRSTLDPSNIYYDNLYDPDFIDLNSFNSVILEYDLDTKYTSKYVKGLDSYVCGLSPFAYDVTNNSDGSRHYKQYFDISQFVKGTKSMPYPKGSVSIKSFDAANRSTATTVTNFKVYAINTTDTKTAYSFKPAITSQPKNASAKYNQEVTFSITGTNLCNGRWYGVSGSNTIFMSESKNYVKSITESESRSQITLIANSQTENMRIYYQTKGSDGSCINSNSVTVSIVDDPVISVNLSGLKKPVADQCLADSLDYRIQTYRGKVYEGTFPLSYKSLYCANNEGPNLMPGMKASYNTKYQAIVEMTSKKLNQDGNISSPFISGMYSVYLDQMPVLAGKVSVLDGGFSSNVVLDDLGQTDKYPVSEVKDMAVGIISDEESTVCLDEKSIVDNIAFAHGDSTQKVLSLDYVITNQNRFSLDSDLLKSNVIKITGKATRPGVVYEARFKMTSLLYEDVFFSVVVSAKEEGKMGRYGMLLSPGLYDGNTLATEWNELLDDNRIDCSGIILYGTDVFEKDEDKTLILSRKLIRIKKDAFDDSKIKKLQFGNNIKLLGNNALSGISDLYYEGTIDEWNQLINASGSKISSTDFTIHFIDFKEPTIHGDFDNLIFDGEEKTGTDTKVVLKEGINYRYEVLTGKLTDEKITDFSEIKPEEYTIAYKNNIDAGTATITATAVDNSFVTSRNFEIQKAKAPEFDKEIFKNRINTYTQILQRFSLFGPLPENAGLSSYEKISEEKSDNIDVTINTGGLITIKGYALNPGTDYKAEFIVSSKNYEDYRVEIELCSDSISDKAAAEYMGKKYTFEELVNVGLVEIDENGRIGTINPSLEGGIAIPDYVDTDKYRGYITGFTGINYKDILLSSIVMDKCEHIDSINDSLFSDNLAIKTVILPSTLKAIGKASFKNCKSLEFIYIPDSVKEIGSSAFMNDSALLPLTENELGIKLPEIEVINSNTFANCTSLSTQENPFIIPESVKKIKTDALEGLEYLSYLGEKSDFENMIDDYLSGEDKGGFNYKGQKITYPTNLNYIELCGENPGEYVYNNEECRPGFIVWTYEGIYFTYEREGNKLDCIASETEAENMTYLCGGLGYSTSYKDNNGVGEGKLKVSGIGKYKGICEKSFKINRGKLDGRIAKDLIIDLNTLALTGSYNRLIDKNVYAKGINLGDGVKLEISNIGKNDQSSYTINSDGEISLSIGYDLSERDEGSIENVFSANAKLCSKNFEDYEFDIRYEVVLAKCYVPSVCYTGFEQRPAVCVEFRDKKFKEGTDYTCEYYNNCNKGIAKVVIKGMGSVVGSKELEFEILNGNITAVEIEKDDKENRGGKNATISYSYNENNELIYEIEERVGCLIDLEGDCYYLRDYLPKDMGEVSYVLTKLESDDEELFMASDGEDKLEISGRSEYPANCIAKATYEVSSANYGDFFVEFSIRSIRPAIKSVNDSVYSNIDLYNKSVDMTSYFPKDIVKCSISPVLIGGNYSKYVDFCDAKLVFSSMSAKSGRILYGSFVGRDENYQSYKINLYVDADNKSVSTVDTVRESLSEGFSAEYIKGYIFTGKKIKPSVKITDNTGRELIYKKDYVIKYKNNLKANLSPLGEVVCQKYNKKTKTYSELVPSIIICYKGAYKSRGREQLDFKIIQKDISCAEIDANEKSLAKSFAKGNTKFVRSVLDRQNKKISKGEYSIYYVNQSVEKSVTNIVNNKVKQVGNTGSTYIVRVMGKRNYFGSFDTVYML